MTRTDGQLQPVTLSRLSHRGVLLGLTLLQLACLGAAVLAAVASLYLDGTTGLLIASPLWLTAAALALVPVAGRPAVAWAPLASVWAYRTLTGQTRYNRRLVPPKPSGALALPGDAARLRYLRDPHTGVAYIHDPHQGTLTAVLEVAHPAFALLDPAEQERRVQAWGRVLAGLCRSPRIARLQLLERTVPDSGSGLERWWLENGVDDGGWAASTYLDLIQRAGPVGDKHVSTISLAIDLRKASRDIRLAGGGRRGAIHVLQQEMTTLSTALRSAELHPRSWYEPEDFAAVLRTAYDPDAAATLDRTRVGRRLKTAGPVAVEESWDRLRTDTAWHAVLWISEWPRSAVLPGFLSPLVLSTGVRRSISLTFQPVRPDLAVRAIRREKTKHLSDQALRAKIGQIEDAAQTAELRDVLQQEAELTSGHGILHYTGLIAVTAPTPDELDAACATIEHAAIAASCETRRLYMQQAQAFIAAALPLCWAV